MNAFLGSTIVPFLTVAVMCFSTQAPARQPHTGKHTAPNHQAAENVPSQTFEQQLIIVEDLAAEVHSDSGTISVTAKIKNVSRAMIKGYATVHLLSGEGKRVLSYEEELNGGEPFAHGTTVEFEVIAKVADVKKISSITVDFTRT